MAESSFRFGASGLALAVCLVGVTGIAVNARAQTPAGLTDQEIRETGADDVSEESRQDVEGLESGREAARESGELQQGAGGSAITLQQILSDPDNISLNFRYARQLVAEGELTEAASALERILLLDPKLARVRLFLALVYYRMDSLAEAEAQLRKLEGEPMSAKLRSDLADLRSRIIARQRVTKLSATIALGTRAQTNANGIPLEESINARPLILGTRIDLQDVETAKPQEDMSLKAMTRVDISHKLPSQADHELVGSVTWALNDQTTVDSQDYSLILGDAGAVWHLGAVDVTTKIFANLLRLDDKYFNHSLGGKFRLETGLMNGRLTLGAQTSVEHQTYYKVAALRSHRRSGMRYDTSVDAGFRITPTQKVDLSVGWLDKRAEAAHFSYDRLSIDAGHTWLLGSGMYLRNSFGYQYDLYQSPDDSVSYRTRKDESVKARSSFGMPFGAVLPADIAPEGVRKLRMTVGAEYEYTWSSIQNYAMENYSGDLMLSRKFDF